MSTAHKTQEELEEHWDSEEVLARKIDQLVALFRRAQYPIVWTGAGISTSSGISDFRGPTGAHTLRDQGKAHPNPQSLVSPTNAVPSLAHLALVSMLKHGLLKFIISTNCDGLHRRSGVDQAQIAELHGNCNKAICKNERCPRRSRDELHSFSMADVRIRKATHAHRHETGYACPRCGSEMHDTIINFGEYLLSDVYQTANAHGDRADMLLVLGSSLRVITSTALDSIIERGGDLVIINRQITPYDKHCAVRIFHDTDVVLRRVMEILGAPIEPWILKRFVDVTRAAAGEGFGGGGAAAAAAGGGAAAAVASPSKARSGGNAKKKKASAKDDASTQPEGGATRLSSSSSSASPPVCVPACGSLSLAFQGVDESGIPYSWMKSAQLGTLAVVDANGSTRFTPLVSPSLARSFTAQQEQSPPADTVFLTANNIFKALCIDVTPELRDVVAERQQRGEKFAVCLNTFEHRGEVPCFLDLTEELGSATASTSRLALHLLHSEKRWTVEKETKE